MGRRGGWLGSILFLGAALLAWSPAGADEGAAASLCRGHEMALPATASASETVRQHRWATYRNARFGTTIEYPADLFAMLPPPENEDGRAFVSRDGKARFLVFGSHNVFDRTLGELAEDDAAEGGYDSVTYRRVADDWYVLSGYRGGDVFYRKVLLSADGAIVHTFDIGYPRELKQAFDPIVSRMAGSVDAAP